MNSILLSLSPRHRWYLGSDGRYHWVNCWLIASCGHLIFFGHAKHASDLSTADCLIGNLDEIREIRADLIWNLAYDGAGDLTLMTEGEKQIYRDLSDLARTLRGEA